MRTVILIICSVFLGLSTNQGYAQTNSENFEKGLITGFKLAGESKIYNLEVAEKYCKIFAVQQGLSEGFPLYTQFMDGCLQGYKDGYGK